MNSAGPAASTTFAPATSNTPNAPCPASEVCHRFEPLPQLLRNVRFKGGRPLENENVVKTIEAARGRLGAGGRLVIRPSGTEPVIRVMAEADDRALVDALVAEICDAVALAAA